MEGLQKLFEKYTGRPVKETEELNSSGSKRRYFRLKGGNISLIGVIGTNKDENNAFISLSRHFRALMTRSLSVLHSRRSILSVMLKGSVVQMLSMDSTSFWMLWMAKLDSSGISSLASIYSEARFFRSAKAVLYSSSVSSDSTSAVSTHLPIRKGLVFVMSTRVHLPRACTMAVTLLPGPGISSTLTSRAKTPV